MERNDGPSAAGGGGMPEANEFSGSGGTSGTPGASRPIDSFDFSGSAGIVDPPSRLGVREKLADALQSGAEKLRDRGARSGSDGATAGGDTSSATFAGVTGGGSVSVETDASGPQVTDRVAGGMDAAADWLREADIDGLKHGIERQVQEHPARTLLIAAGIGYLLGRALRKDH